MRTYFKLGLLALVPATTLVFAACGDTQGRDDLDSGAAGDATQATEETTGGMDHGSMGAGEMLMENGEYSDERFIDAMVPHHQGAIDMAEVALENAGHEEIQTLSEDIISAQAAEIGELESIKQEEFGTSKVPIEMSAEEMESMGMMMDPRELANAEPFDLAFIDAMIPHHQSAVEMANVAREETGNPRIKDLAGNIVDAQEKEIKQMTGWRKEWYPER